MARQALSAELTDDEFEEIDRILARIKGGEVPNVETLDGFLTALVVCPDLVKPSEYVEVIMQGESEDDDLVFEDMAEAERFYELLMRHWNTINRAFRSKDFYMPHLKENEDGIMPANDWANGFLKGTYLRHEIFQEVARDEERGGAFVAIWALAYEHASDPDIRPFREPITPEKRQQLIAIMVAGVKHLYDDFEEDRRAMAPRGRPSSRFGPKVGRNDPCPCGSGKKFKKCCGQVTIH